MAKNQQDWDDCLKPALFAYRTSINSSTQESPFFLVHGRDPRFPCDTSLLPAPTFSKHLDQYISDTMRKLQKAKCLAESNNSRTQLYREQQHKNGDVERRFLIGDKVWLYIP